MTGRGILLLEDDPDVASMIVGMLDRDGWLTEHAATLTEGYAALRSSDPCIVIVDLGLPDGSGMNFVRDASARSNTGVIVVSGQGDEVDRVLGLEVGADDYIQKPFSPREMTARVRALYRRLGGGNSLDSFQSRPASAPPPQSKREQQSLRVQDVLLDPARMRISGPLGAFVSLTGGEADLLSRLINSGDEALGRHEVAEDVLGHKLQPLQRGIDQLASNLRRKLESVAGESIRIIAVRGKGYRLIY